MVFYLEGRGDSSLHLSTAAPVLCSQQPNRTDTPSPCMKPLWGWTRGNVLCVCLSSSSASGPWCVGSLWAQSVCVSDGGITKVNIRPGSQGHLTEEALFRNI